MSIFSKEDLAEALVKKFHFNKKQSRQVLNYLLDTITKTLADHRDVQLTNFGSFRVSHRKARQGVNPQNQSKLTIPAHNVPVFHAGKHLKQSVNK